MSESTCTLGDDFSNLETDFEESQDHSVNPFVAAAPLFYIDIFDIPINTISINISNAGVKRNTTDDSQLVYRCVIPNEDFFQSINQQLKNLYVLRHSIHSIEYVYECLDYYEIIEYITRAIINEHYEKEAARILAKTTVSAAGHMASNTVIITDYAEWRKSIGNIVVLKFNPIKYICYCRAANRVSYRIIRLDSGIADIINKIGKVYKVTTNSDTLYIGSISKEVLTQMHPDYNIAAVKYDIKKIIKSIEDECADECIMHKFKYNEYIVNCLSQDVDDIEPIPTIEYVYDAAKCTYKPLADVVGDRIVLEYNKVSMPVPMPVKTDVINELFDSLISNHQNKFAFKNILRSILLKPSDNVIILKEDDYDQFMVKWINEIFYCLLPDQILNPKEKTKISPNHRVVLITSCNKSDEYKYITSAYQKGIKNIILMTERHEDMYDLFNYSKFVQGNFDRILESIGIAALPDEVFSDPVVLCRYMIPHLLKWTAE